MVGGHERRPRYKGNTGRRIACDNPSITSSGPSMKARKPHPPNRNGQIEASTYHPDAPYESRGATAPAGPPARRNEARPRSSIGSLRLRPCAAASRPTSALFVGKASVNLRVNRLDEPHDCMGPASRKTSTELIARLAQHPPSHCPDRPGEPGYPVRRRPRPEAWSTWRESRQVRGR